MTDLQKILDERFPTVADAIAKYGRTELMLSIPSPRPLQPPVADPGLDLISEQVRPTPCTRILLRLEQFYALAHPNPVYWWQFVNVGEI